MRTKFAMVMLSDVDVKRLLDLDQLRSAIAEALAAIAAGTVVAPSRTVLSDADGGLYLMPGYLPGYGLGCKLVTNFPLNSSRGLPTVQALVALFDISNGAPLVLLEATYLTAARTAAASAVATSLCATADSATLAIIGSGPQAEAHLAAMMRIRTFTDIRIASRTFNNAERLAAKSPGVVAMPTIEQAVRGADVVCGCIDSRVAAIRAEWLKTGAHINSVGGFHGREIDEAIVDQADIFVESFEAAMAPPHGASELTGIDRSRIKLIGSMVGDDRGYTRERRYSLFKSTGHAAEDIAASKVVYERALAAESRGTEHPLHSQL